MGFPSEKLTAAEGGSRRLRRSPELKTQGLNPTDASSQSSLGGTHSPAQSVKTNKGDALANRVQNTLGNYDEMKELLTNHSNQSHLVGIPKSSAPPTPMEKPDQPSFFAEGPRGRTAPSQQQGSAPMPPPQSSAAGVQVGGPACGRGKHAASAHEQPQSRHDDLFAGQGDAHKGDSSPAPSASSSSHGRRHGQASKAPPSADHAYKEGGQHAKSPSDPDPGLHASGSSPVASTSLLPSGLSTPTFPQGLHCKPSAVQQKPTAYVRPMDGQDQVPNDSPELKPPVEIGDGYSGSAFGGLLDGKAGAASAKSKLPKLTLPQPGESVTPVMCTCRVENQGRVARIDAGGASAGRRVERGRRRGAPRRPPDQTARSPRQPPAKTATARSDSSRPEQSRRLHRPLRRASDRRTLSRPPLAP
ncbi:hypothetical protein AAFF_G00058690 [Aldrovandia affinis]|uniref:Uncharacterized protein n=1 Tax=Aldrovandia affinis TaxID=143900 RepID=A0AAD7S0K5_9TELE|nr:hypothetical protein AAFF_G00058690 [Aldrovandia affinis]